MFSNINLSKEKISMHKHHNENEEVVKAIFHLLIDHKVTREVIDKLELKLAEFEAKNEISISFMISLVNFLSKFLDRCHHGKEEKCLFPLLENLGIPREGGPIGVMLIEHQEMRETISKINEMLKLYSEGKQNASVIISYCKDLIGLIRSHFFKEENILFRTGSEIIPNSEDIKTVTCYEEIEKDIDHDKLLQEVEKLKES